MTETFRIDKWLWAVRLFKTRGLAAEACSKGQVFIGDIAVKPSRLVKTGDVIRVRKAPIYRSYQVTGLIGKRVSAKEVPAYMTEVTLQSELDILINQKDMKWISRERGAGRPTKKERRELDDFFGT